jgi:hypothetical protein
MGGPEGAGSLVTCTQLSKVLEQLYHRHFLRYCSSQTHHIEGSSSCECAVKVAFQIGNFPPLHGEKEMSLFLFLDGA